MGRPRSKRVSRKTIAVLALMESGVADYAKIAEAIGVPEADVKRIDAADDRHVRRIALDGVPTDFQYTLRHKIYCPRCGRRITLVPCIGCRIAKIHDADPHRRVAFRHGAADRHAANHVQTPTYDDSPAAKCKRHATTVDHSIIVT